jgi:flagellar biosynthesis protein FliR
MQPVLLNVSDISQWVTRLWWPVLRVGGFVVSAPIASEATIPGPVKIALSLGLAFILGPLAPVPPGLSVFSAAGALAAVQEVFIGIAIGMVMRLAFEALAFAGQSVSLTMGLGFASLVDPAHGAETPVLGHARLSRHERAPRADRRPSHEFPDVAHRRPERR